MSALAARHRTAAGIAGAVLVAAGLGALVARQHEQLAVALGTAPIWILAIAVVLQIVALVARSEAWNVCVRAAGGTVTRRRLFRAAGMGYVGSLLNGQFGVAARIAALRRSAPQDSPRAPALIAAEVPILTVEATLAAVTSFTLIGPLGLPWWLPIAAVALMLALTAALGGLARRRRTGLWKGLAVLRSLHGRTRIVALVLVAVFAQIARNWLVLRALGVDASLLDAIAVLIAMVVLSQLPVGPGVGAAAVVLVLGANGLGVTAAAGVLLTATGTAGALCYAGWAVADRMLCGNPEARLATASAGG